MRSKVKAIMIVVVVFFVLSCFAGYGLYVGSGKTAKSARDYPVATVDTLKIMRSELDHVTLNLIQEAALEHQETEKDNDVKTEFDVTSKDIQEYRNEAVAILIVQKEGELIREEVKKEAKSRKLEVKPEEIEKEFVKLIEGFATKEEFYLRIESMGITEKQVKDDLRQNLLREKLLEDIKSEISVTEDDARVFHKMRKNIQYGGKEFDAISSDVLADVKKDREESRELLFERRILNKIDVKILDEELFNIKE